MEDYIKKLDEKVGKLCEYAHIIELKKKDYGCGFELTMREIHALEAIANYPYRNSGELAQTLGLLKGTFSKTTKSLIRQGLITRHYAKSNNREITFLVTPLGWKAYEGHYRFHAGKSAVHHEVFLGYSEPDKETILRFIQDYIVYLEDFL